MRYTKKICLLLLAAIAVACSGSKNDIPELAENEVMLDISIKNPMKGKVYIYKVENGGRADFATIDDNGTGKLTQKLTVNEPNFFMINFYNKQEGMIVLTPDMGVLTMSVDGNDSAGIFETSGSRENELVQEYHAFEKELKSIYDDVSKQYAQSSSDEEAAKIAEEYQKSFSEKVTRFLEKSEGHFVSILPAQLLDLESQTATAEKVAMSLQKNYPEATLVKNFANRVAAIKNTAVGNMAPDINLKSPDGENIALSSLRGKFVLIDFWASWCTPCRHENPNVVRMYQRFQEKDFEIYGVSLDRDKEAWEEAIEKDGLGWIHVSDLNFWKSEVVPLYNIEGIPHTVLLDKEGKIIAKNLRGGALESKLEELLL